MSAIFVNQQLKITWTCKDAETGSAIDLTGETVKILIRSPNGTETVVDATIEDAATGVVNHTFAVDDLNEEGEWAAKPFLNDSETPGTVYRFDVSSTWRK